jgi:competence protein ComEC
MSLRAGYFISGIITGLVLLFSVIHSLPDGKLHIVFCDVGQGDAAYVRFPDGRDMLVDAGPNNSVLRCLGKFMPFWDRHINLVLLTHPQKDHMQGLLEVLKRYRVEYFVRSDIANTSEGFAELLDIVQEKKIRQKFVSAGELVTVGPAQLRFIWPTKQQLLTMKNGGDIDLNDGSLVFWLRFGQFDSLFTGDADTRVEHHYLRTALPDGAVEVLKVPHHGSKTGMSDSFLDWLTPDVSVVSVGKNTYGHPTKDALEMLAENNTQVVRTDQRGNVEVVSDGLRWTIK